jgi:hypothetical protein
MIVGHTRFGFYPCCSQKINEGSFELSLPSLEVVAYQNTVFERSILQSFNKGILRRSVDEHTALLDGS